jgi:hypothetical protein
MVLDGDVGIGGGLTALDGGVPFVSARVDSGPSSAARAAAVEPGTLVRTVAGVANTEAGETVLDVPLAEAEFPGDGERSGDALGSLEEDGLRLDGLTASALAQPTVARGTAVVGSAAGEFPGAGPLGLSTGRATTTVTGDLASGALSAVSASRAGRLVLFDQVVIEEVVGTAIVRLEDGERTAVGTTSVGAVTIAGVPVLVTEDGVVVDDTAPLPLGTDDPNAVVAQVLDETGLSLRLLAPTERVEGRSATADSGGLLVTVASPALADGGVPANDLTIVLGAATATLSDEPPPAPLPPLDLGAAPAPPSTAGGNAATPGSSTSGPSTSTAPLPADRPGVDPGPAAQVAPPASDGVVAAPGEEPPRQVLVAGRRVDARTAIAALGAWQLLSLAICTLAAFTLRGGGVPA